MNENKQVEKQLLQVVKAIIKGDQIDNNKNKDFLEIEIIKLIQSSTDKKQVITGLTTFYKITKIYEFENGHLKSHYNNLFDQINLILLRFLSELTTDLTDQTNNLTSRLILKIFFKSILTIWPSSVKSTFNEWMEMLVLCANSEIPLTVSRNESDTSHSISNNKLLEDSSYFKLKFLCFEIWQSIYQKYGLEEITEIAKKEVTQFQDRITYHYSEIFLKIFVNCLQKSKNFKVPEKIVCIIYKYLSLMLSREHLFPNQDQIIEYIIKEHAIQDCLITREDIELYNRVK